MILPQRKHQLNFKYINMSIARSKFLKLEFPMHAYCVFGLKKGSSTKWMESWHYRNANTGVQLNIFWHNDETVSVGVYDPRIENKFEVNKTVLDRTDIFTPEILDKYCKEYLT